MLGNLATLSADIWAAVPPAGERSIASIVLHVGGCLVMYDDYALVPARNDGMTPI